MLDANSMVADFRLQSAASTALMQQAATGAIRVVVPRVVLYEVINKYSEGLQKQLDEIHRQIRALKRFGVAFHDPSESADDLIGAYVKELDSKLKRHRVVVNDYPAVSHAEVAERAVAKRPPFNQQGQGYRDTLIWHTVLEVLASSEVWFVTTDGDFLNQSGELTAALLDDVDALGLTRERIRRFATIEQAVSTLGSIAKEAVTQLRDRLTNDATYYNAMSESIIGLLTYYELDVGDLPEPSEYADEAWVDSVEDVLHVRLRDARPVAPRELFARFTAHCDVRAGLFIHKSEAPGAEADARHGFSITDWDWNESYVRAYMDARLNVEMSGIVRQPEFEVTHLDIDVVSAG